MNHHDIQTVLEKMGEQVPPGSELLLIGGSALTLLGSPRPTIDIDFVGNDVRPNPLHRTIMQIAKELKIHAEPVPLDQFVPLPKGSDKRTIHIGKFGNLEVYVADPYSIALSKLDRGLDTDFDDVLFLLRADYVTLVELERCVEAALPYAKQFDLSPAMRDHFDELKKRLRK